MGNSANFTFWRQFDAGSEKNGKNVINCQKEGAAEAIIENYKGHIGTGEKAYIPASIFGKDKSLDKNDNGKIDQDEIINWLEKMDKMDTKQGKEDGKISAATAAANDNFDLLGFKSGKTETLEEKANLISSEKGLKALNNWADNSVAMFFVEGKIIKGMGKKDGIDYLLKNKSTRNLLAKTKDLNPELVRKIFDKAYGKDEAPKVFNELKALND